MRPVIDYSKDLRRKLADGKSFDAALGELRAAGATIFDCIASVRSFQRCDLAEAKRMVESSSAWSDIQAIMDTLQQEKQKIGGFPKINTVEEQRREMVRVAHGILDGNIGIVAGARQLTYLRFPSRAQTDRDILVFVGIDSETDNFPIGDVRHLWNPEILKVKDAELQAYEARVRERAFEACNNLIARYESVA